MHQKVGRNDPCPCGSGKKFKKCCGREQAATTSERQLPPIDIAGKVIAYITREGQEAWYARAIQKYLAHTPFTSLEELVDAYRNDVEILDAFNLHLHEWILCDYEDDQGKNAIDDYLARRQWSLSRDETLWLKGLRANRMGLFRIDRVSPDGHLELSDCLQERAPIDIIDHSLSQVAAPGMFISTRLVTFAGHTLSSGSAIHVSAERAHALTASLNLTTQKDVPYPLQQLSPEFMGYLLEDYSSRKSFERSGAPNTTGNGGLVTCAEVEFHLNGIDKATFITRLNQHGAFCEFAPNHYQWFTDSGHQHPALGDIYFDTDGYFFTTSDSSILQAGIELLSDLLGHQISFEQPSVELFDEATAASILEDFGDLDPDDIGDLEFDGDSIDHLVSMLSVIVQQQIDNNDPPEVKSTYQRLLSADYTHEECIRFIGLALFPEIEKAGLDAQQYDPASYRRSLARLPLLPDDPD